MVTTFNTDNPENQQSDIMENAGDIRDAEISNGNKLCARIVVMKEFYVDELDPHDPERDAMDSAMSDYIEFMRSNVNNLNIFEDGEFKFYIEYYEMGLEQEYLPDEYIYEPDYAQYINSIGEELDN